MEDKYQVININAYLSDDELKQEIDEITSTFSSPQNKDVETFLKKNAVMFSQKGQSVTYFVVRVSDAMELVGYFTLTVKPISINTNDNNLTKNFYKRIERICKSDENGNYVLSSFLIVQLGKNYNLKENRRIDGKELLGIAMNTLLNIKQQIGGVVVFLECEDSKNNFLRSFYENNGFTLFGERISDGEKKLYQLIKPL
jgi:hypothetical protein